jgi:hypothetical protein
MWDTIFLQLFVILLLKNDLDYVIDAWVEIPRILLDYIIHILIVNFPMMGLKYNKEVVILDIAGIED